MGGKNTGVLRGRREKIVRKKQECFEGGEQGIVGRVAEFIFQRTVKVSANRLGD